MGSTIHNHNVKRLGSESKIWCPIHICKIKAENKRNKHRDVLDLQLVPVLIKQSHELVNQYTEHAQIQLALLGPGYQRLHTTSYYNFKQLNKVLNFSQGCHSSCMLMLQMQIPFFLFLVFFGRLWGVGLTQCQ